MRPARASRAATAGKRWPIRRSGEASVPAPVFSWVGASCPFSGFFPPPCSCPPVSSLPWTQSSALDLSCLPRRLPGSGKRAPADGAGTVKARSPHGPPGAAGCPDQDFSAGGLSSSERRVPAPRFGDHGGAIGLKWAEGFRGDCAPPSSHAAPIGARASKISHRDRRCLCLRAELTGPAATGKVANPWPPPRTGTHNLFRATA